MGEAGVLRTTEHMEQSPTRKMHLCDMDEQLLLQIMRNCESTSLALLQQSCSTFKRSRCLIETAVAMKVETNHSGAQMRTSVLSELNMLEAAASNAKDWSPEHDDGKTEEEARCITETTVAKYVGAKVVAKLKEKSLSCADKYACAELLAKYTHTSGGAAGLLASGAAPFLVQLLRSVSSSREHLTDLALGVRHWSLQALSDIFVHHSPKVGPIAATAVELLVTLLGSQSDTEQDHAVIALGCIDHAVIALGCIFRFHGNLRDSIAATAVEPMVTLLKRNCSVCTKVKVAAFFSEMSIYEQHAAAVVHGGAIPYLIEMFTTESTQIAATGVLHNISHFSSLTGEGEKHFLAIVDSCNVSLCRLTEALKLPFTQKVASAIMSQIAHRAAVEDTEIPSKRSKLE